MIFTHMFALQPVHQQRRQQISDSQITKLVVRKVEWFQVLIVNQSISKQQATLMGESVFSQVQDAKLGVLANHGRQKFRIFIIQ